jgi:hypothetical protein
METREENIRNKQLEARVLQQLVSYTEFQCGNRVIGGASREWGNGDHIEGDSLLWKLEIDILFPNYEILYLIYQKDETLSMIARANLMFPFCQKMLGLLKPWSINFDLNSTSRVNNLDKKQINHMLKVLSVTEGRMGDIQKRRNLFDSAGVHCQRAVSFGRLYDEEDKEKTKILCSALNIFYDLRATEGNYVDGLALAEEAYNCVAIAYNPVHPEVQAAAGTLIECLIHKGDSYNAERYAELTLESLKDPKNGLNQQSEEVSKGYYFLAKAIDKRTGDLVRAEMLARESLRIRSRLYSHDNECIGTCASLLSGILLAQGKVDHETKELIERTIAIYTKHCGVDGANTAFAYTILGNFYYDKSEARATNLTKKKCLSLSIIQYKEALRIYTKLFGPNNPKTKGLSSSLRDILRELSEA